MIDGFSEEERQKAGAAGIRFFASQEEQQLERLKEAMARTGDEKFYFLMQLMKLQQLFKGSVIKHKK